MTAIDYRIGVLLSAGGAAFIRAAQLSRLDPSAFYVVTDRECGAETSCSNHDIPHQRIPYAERRSFSQQAAEAFRDAGCKVVLLHYSRLVSSDLFNMILTVNTHPSLLPAYPGLDGVGDAYKDKSLYQGATLHIVDEGMDTGHPIAQTIYPVPKDASLRWRNRLGFIQKTIVTLFLFDMVKHNRIDIDVRDVSAFDLDGISPGEFSNPRLLSSEINHSVKQLFEELPEDPDWVG